METFPLLVKIVPSGDFESIETIDFVSSYVQKEWTDYHVEHNFRIYIEEMERGQGQAQRGANTNDVTAVEVCRMCTELRQELKQVEAEEAALTAVLMGKTTCPEGVGPALFALYKGMSKDHQHSMLDNLTSILKDLTSQITALLQLQAREAEVETVSLS